MKILFLGTYLSSSLRSQGPSELLASKLTSMGFQCTLISKRKNVLTRVIDSIFYAFFTSYDNVFLDIYSSRTLYLSNVLSNGLRLMGRPYSCILHGGALPDRYKKIEKILLPILGNAKHILTPSLFLKLFFEAKGYKVLYIPNPIELDKFPYKRDMVKPLSLLWVRAFTQIYNPNVPVLVLQMVLENFPEATLTMIGPDKGMMHETKQLINQLNLGNKINVLGPIENEKLHEYYQSHAVYLNTTSYESFGVAVVEAASCGIPVVSFRVGEIPFLWKDEENILLAPHLDVGAMTHQVKRIFEDELLSNKLALNARKRAEEFSWGNIKAHWLQLLS